MEDKKIKFTDSDFRKKHYELWDWCAETGKSKEASPAIKALSKLGNNLDKAVFEAWRTDCFACGAAVVNGKRDCAYCPIEWGCRCCTDKSTLFNKWIQADSIEDRKNYAKQITQLLWRGKEREKQTIRPNL